MTLIAPGSLPCAAVSTVVTVILLAASWLITRALGGVGSPSLMMTMCLLIASLTPFEPLHRHLERRVEVGHVAGRHAVDGAEHAAPPGPDRPQGEQPGLLAFPVQHAGVVVARERR